MTGCVRGSTLGASILVFSQLACTDLMEFDPEDRSDLSARCEGELSWLHGFEAQMTYNFDPDEWYERELTFLHGRRARGDLGEAQLAAAIEDLDRRYDEMVDRLDGTYRIGSAD